MKIAGLVKTSLIDFPGKVSAVVFTQGCNFACGFCHNPELVPVERAGEMTESELFNFLTSRVGKLDGVVVTGGEPTIQSDLPDFLSRIKKIGYSVKLDTNGSNPIMLKKILDGNLVDYVAMDVKGAPGRYPEICGFSNFDSIKKSINLLIHSGAEAEFRTTALPHFHQISDFEDIGEVIKGAKRYTLQGFRPGKTLDSSLSSAKSFNRTELEEVATVMRKYVSEVKVHDNLEQAN